MEIKKYIKITRWMCGKSLSEQIDNMMQNGLLDENTRVFFSKNNMLCTEDIAEMLTYFDVIIDNDFDINNAIFRPNKLCIKEQKKILDKHANV